MALCCHRTLLFVLFKVVELVRGFLHLHDRSHGLLILLSLGCFVGQFPQTVLPHVRIAQKYTMFIFSASTVHIHTHLYVRMFMHHVSIIARDVGRNNCAGAGAGHCILHCLHVPVSANDAVMKMENNDALETPTAHITTIPRLRRSVLLNWDFHVRPKNIQISNFLVTKK